MPLIQKLWSTRSEVSLYCPGEHKVKGKDASFPEEVRAPSRSYNLVLESVLRQRGAAEYAAGSSAAFKAAKKTANVTDRSTTRSHGRKAGNQIGDFTAACIAGSSCGTHEAKVKITPPKNHRLQIKQNTE